MKIIDCRGEELLLQKVADKFGVKRWMVTTETGFEFFFETEQDAMKWINK